MSKLKAIAVKRGIFRDSVKFWAEKSCSVTFGSLLGDKVYYLNKDYTVVVDMKKSEMWEVGEYADFAKLVRWDQDKFNWDWVGGTTF